MPIPSRSTTSRSGSSPTDRHDRRGTDLMTIELRPGHSSPPNIVELLAGFDELAVLGVNVEHKALKPVRRAAERVRELRQQNADIRARGADAELQRTVREYADGAIEA